MRQELSAVIVAAIGMVGLVKDLTNFFNDPELTLVGFLVTTGIPGFVNLALIATGVWLWYDDSIPPVRSLLPWVVGLGLVFVSLEWVSITHQQVRGVEVANPTQTLLNGFIRGAFVGTLFSLYADRRRVAERQRRQLKEQNERLEQFSGIVSHDLRNPLSVAQARLELLEADVDSEHVGHIERAHERMATLVDDLLSLAKGGSDNLDREAVVLANLIEECWRTVETGNATLENELDGTIVHADRSRLRQLVENLVRNAIEHGGPAVSVTVRPTEDGFAVADDGQGIPPDEREDVFELGHSTGDGTGYGLAIVREVVDEHGWSVDVTESAVGGARFDVAGAVRGD